MSVYTTVETQFKDSDCLIAALKEIGFQPEVHETAVPLQGYDGGSGRQRAEIVVRQAAAGTWVDIGFQRQADGTYRVHMDRDTRTGARFTKQTLQQLKQRYAVQALTTQAAKRGYTVASEINDKGKVRMVLRRFA